MYIRRGIRKNEISLPPERDVPYDVPYREVEHQEEDFGPGGFDCITGLGTIKDREYWGGTAEWRKEYDEVKKREKRRREIGGFGFRVERA